MVELNTITKFVIIPALFFITLIILGFIYPTSSNLYQEEFKSNVTKTKFRSNRLKVTSAISAEFSCGKMCFSLARLYFLTTK